MLYRKKLIEAALPIDAINREAAREKSIRHGRPSTRRLWWVHRSIAACRAVLFASLVDDPSEYMPDAESARCERDRLFKLTDDLVRWENSTNEDDLLALPRRAGIRRATDACACSAGADQPGPRRLPHRAGNGVWNMASRKRANGERARPLRSDVADHVLLLPRAGGTVAAPGVCASQTSRSWKRANGERARPLRSALEISRLTICNL